VPAPGVAIELIQAADNSGPQGIEVDIANQFQKIGFFFADDGFVTILKKMAGPAIAEIEGRGITGEQAAHEAGKFLLSRAQQEMNVIG
jgi:hypothetical protein